MGANNDAMTHRSFLRQWRCGANSQRESWTSRIFSCSDCVSFYAPKIHCANKMTSFKLEDLVWSPSLIIKEIAQSGRKRTWSSASNNSSRSSESGGRQTPRSASWRELRDSGRFNSGGQPRYQGEQQRHSTTGYAGHSGNSGSDRSTTSYRQDYDTTATTTTRLGTGTRTAAIGAAEVAAAAVASQPGSDPAGSGRHSIMASQGFSIYSEIWCCNFEKYNCS